MSTLFSVGQMNQLGDALEEAGFTLDDVTKLRSFDQLGAIRDVVRGFAEIVPKQHVIDCDQDPFCPSGWKVESHQKSGRFTWDPTKVELHLSPNQQDGKVITGTKLQKELSGMPVLNANILDYLLAHPELIPEDWKGKYVNFWGTIYRDSDGDLSVRYLFWNDGQWDWDYIWLVDDWYDLHPAALVCK